MTEPSDTFVAPPGPTPVSLYVHVPFCASKCSYCDFHSAAEDPGRLLREDDDVVWYVRSRLPESASLADAYAECVLAFLEEFCVDGLLAEVPTLYVGGGTPTMLGLALPYLVRGVRDLVGLRADAEVTVEANPDSLTPALAQALADAGVARVSLGVQSFDDEVLRTLGRPHDAASARAAARMVTDAGMRLSVDLMCGVPEQSAGSWRGSIEAAVSTGAGHVSVYPLTIEDGTPMAEAIAGATMAQPDPDTAADMMAAAEELLGAEGLARYEVANYARPGEESRHNLGYWTGRPYLGVGASAASMLPAGFGKATPLGARLLNSWPDDWRARFTWNMTTESFLAELWDRSPDEAEALTPDQAAREDVMLGMRLVAGVSEEQVDAAGVTEVMERLEADGLVERAEGRWRTTHRGWLLGNEVFSAVWAG